MKAIDYFDELLLTQLNNIVTLIKKPLLKLVMKGPTGGTNRPNQNF